MVGQGAVFHLDVDEFGTHAGREYLGELSEGKVTLVVLVYKLHYGVKLWLCGLDFHLF